MKAIICGGRYFNDWDVFRAVVAKAPPVTHIISGMAPGADTMAIQYAKSMGIPYSIYKADWRTYGKGAGPIRNQRMLDDGEPEMVIAMPGGRGTADMVKRAHAAGIKVVS